MGNGGLSSASSSRSRRRRQNEDNADPDAGGHLPYYNPAAELLENQKANTIKNDVNLKRTTLRLEEDEENPGSYLVAFSFDATLAGWICIFFQAREGEECSLNAVRPELRIPFEKGLGQRFRQAAGTGVRLSSLFEFEEEEAEVFPLVVRMVRGGEVPAAGAPLPKWVHAQTTHAVLEKRDDEAFLVRVVKQIIYVEGVRYELQEIYGIENSDGSSVGVDAGKECVICLCELRDTTVLPCRHMCMCSACAKVLRFQSNRCPICRTPVERLLEIKVCKKEEEEEQGAAHQEG